jgi:hypothetical protein
MPEGRVFFPGEEQADLSGLLRQIDAFNKARPGER